MSAHALDPRQSVRPPERASCVNCAACGDCLPGSQAALAGRKIERLVVRRCQLQRGEHLFRMDQVVGPRLYAIRTGQFKLYQLSARGQQQVAGFPGAGEVLGWEALGLSHYRCNAVALCASTVCEFSLPQWRMLPARMLPDLPRLLSRGLAREEWLAVQLGHGAAAQKLVCFLLTQMAAVPDGQPLHLGLWMTREDMGDFLGLSATTVSRLLRQMERAGCLVLRPHGVQLQDVGLLRHFAGLPGPDPA